MRVFVDSEFKCHTDNPAGAYQAVENEFFDGKCPVFVEGYRYIPEGRSWIREDGKTFSGEAVMPFQDYSLLAAAQAQYEADQAELEAAYQEGVNSV